MSIKYAIPLVLLMLVAGCASDGKKEPTARDAAKKHWNSARAGVLYSLGKSQYETGNFDSCRKTLNEAMTMDPQSVPIHLLSAKLSIEQSKLELAEKELELCRTLDPNNAEADYLSGVICQRWQKPQASLVYYENASKKAPAELAYVMAKAETLVAVDRRSEALSLLCEKLVYHENSATIRDAVGLLLVQEGKYADAAAILRQASILATDEPAIREHLALALYYAREYREATGVLEKLLKEERYSTRADLLIALGECQLQTGRAREARESFESAAQLQPSSALVWLSLAKAALQINDTGRAELSLRKALALEAGNSEAHLLMGYLRLRQEKLDEALSAFRKASALDRNDSVSMCMCGVALEKLNRAAEAIRCYADALKLKPGDDLAATLMAQIQLQE